MDIYNVHCKLHPDTDKVIDLSIDGISKDKSSQIPIEVFSVRFPNCKRIYTWCAVKVCVHEAYDLDEFLDACIQQIMYVRYRPQHCGDKNAINFQLLQLPSSLVHQRCTNTQPCSEKSGPHRILGMPLLSGPWQN